MANTTIPSFVDALRQLQLLDGPRLDEIARLQATHPDARALAREVLKRGWLTAFQLNQVFQGRGRELLLGQYVIVERLGEGGMGQVFKARHRRLDRIDALKVVRKEHLANALAVQRFHQEARAAARVAHTNIVSIYDAAEADGIHFLAMEYVDGLDLARLVQRDGPLPIAAACEYVRQAALGLEHAHEAGIVHRDIKPSNLFVTLKSGTIKVLDLGLARMLKAAHDGDEAGGLTHTGVVMGTPDYMSPEQAMNSSGVDIRGDIYSLGGTLYFLLTGQPPFAGGSLTEKLLRRQLEDARPVTELRPDVPPELAAVVARMLARKPEDRFATPGEVAEVLEPFCQGVTAPRRRTGVTLPSIGNPGSTASLVKASVTTAVDSPRPATMGALLGSAQRQVASGFGRLSTRGRLLIAGGVFLGCFLFVLCGALLVRAAFRGAMAVVAGPAPVATTAARPATGPATQPQRPGGGTDAMAGVYQAFRLKNWRVEGGPQQRAGEQLGITYDLVNTADKELTIPAQKGDGQPGYSLGSCQHWVERLGSDPTIPGIPLSAGRRGNLYAAGKSVVWADRTVAKNQAYQFANPLETTGYPPGRYRYHIEYLKHNDEVIQKEAVEFELTAPTPQDPRENLLAQLIGKPAVPLEVAAWVNGSPLGPDDLKGKVVLLDFWAVWCPPCRAAFPHLRTWHEKYESRGLVMVGLTRYYGYGWDDATKAARKIPGLTPPAEQEAMGEFVRHNNLKYRIGFVPGASDFYQRYAVGGIPHVVLIDRQGKIRLVKVGYSAGTSAAIEDMIQKLLAER